jgi:hypothetical protein
MEKGDRVVIVGDHPWATSAGELLTWEILPAIRTRMWRVVLDKGMECYVRPENIRVTKSVARRRA